MEVSLVGACAQQIRVRPGKSFKNRCNLWNQEWARNVFITVRFRTDIARDRTALFDRQGELWDVSIAESTVCSSI